MAGNLWLIVVVITKYHRRLGGWSIFQNLFSIPGFLLPEPP